MNSRRNPRRLVAAVLVGVLAGGGLMATTPAGAEVAQSAATNWKKIWTKKIQRHADARYYKKADSDARYAPASALANFYDKAASDARYQPKGSYAAAGSSYSKAESDAKYAPYPGVIRGTYISQVSPNTGYLTSDINFGVTLAVAPTVHYIQAGDPVPAGCSGTVAAPNAAPGHLCVFESGSSNVSGEYLFDPAGLSSGSSTFGASILGTQTSSAGTSWWRGSWAVRPGGPVVSPASATRSPGALNTSEGAGSLAP